MCSLAVLIGSASLAEPAAQSVLTPAAVWVEALVLGSIATTLGVLAIAACGLLMLWGRIDVRRGLTVVLGCFIIFGAPSIAAGLRSVGNDGEASESRPALNGPLAIAPIPTAPSQPSGYDPYAGASIAR